MTNTTAAELDAAEKKLEEQAASQRADLAARRANLAAATESARHKAAAARLADLDDDLIPANTLRAAAAREALAEIISTGTDPLVEALTTIVETHLAEQALHLEASSMAATVGAPPRPALRQLAPDPVNDLAEAILTAAQARQPVPVALPAEGRPRPTHEEAMAAERAKRHTDVRIMTVLGLTPEDIAALDREAYAVKVTEAEAVEVQRQQKAEAAAREQERERRPQFRASWGRSTLG